MTTQTQADNIKKLESWLVDKTGLDWIVRHDDDTYRYIADGLITMAAGGSVASVKAAWEHVLMRQKLLRES